MLFFTNFIYLTKKLNLNEIYTIKFEIPTSGPFLNEKLHEDSRYIFPSPTENTT